MKKKHFLDVNNYAIERNRSSSVRITTRTADPWQQIRAVPLGLRHGTCHSRESLSKVKGRKVKGIYRGTKGVSRYEIVGVCRDTMVYRGTGCEEYGVRGVYRGTRVAVTLVKNSAVSYVYIYIQSSIIHSSIHLIIF